MQKVKGIGGIFFKTRDPKALGAWYRDQLGVPVEEWGGASFGWHPPGEPERRANTIWSPFAADTPYFAPSDASFMVNYRVEDLDAMLAQLAASGIDPVGGIEESESGRFAWVLDPEGNKVELWQPPDEGPST